MRFYPNISPELLTPFKAIRSLMLKDKDYLNAEECPYTDEIKLFLSEAFGGDPLKPSEPQAALETPEDLERELIELFTSMKTLQKDVQTIDTRDRIQWAKAVVSILERLIELRERNLNTKQMSEFQKAVITILDEVCEPAQRTDISQRLQRFA